jgi:hypothetical protein
MDAELRPRLPLDHPDRIKARDLKLHLRDCERANRNGLSRYRCPCNLCGGRRRPYKTSTVARHLRHRGRHGALRGWTQVMNFTAPVNVVSYTLLFENLLLCPGIYVMVVVPFLLLTNSF